MKKIIVILSLMILFTCFTTTVYAHPGRTDSSGGHYNSLTGEYHYHHGMPAHQHKNGECPYRGWGLVKRVLIITGIVVVAIGGVAIYLGKQNKSTEQKEKPRKTFKEIWDTFVGILGILLGIIMFIILPIVLAILL